MLSILFFIQQQRSNLGEGFYDVVNLCDSPISIAPFARVSFRNCDSKSLVIDVEFLVYPFSK
jgi:hypothetical protein